MFMNSLEGELFINISRLLRLPKIGDLIAQLHHYLAE